MPLSILTLADVGALIFLVSAWIGIGWITEHPPRGRPSVSSLMVGHREAWMRQFVSRDNRIFDGNILASLRAGTSFFASASMLAIGGALALIGRADEFASIARDFDLDSNLVWEVKLIVPVIILVNAFLKFVWSHRLFGYCAIMMAAVPQDAKDPTALPLALRAAALNASAARSFNAGLRSVYFAMAALAWLAGPAALVVAASITLWVTWRREFASRSREVIQA